MGEKGEIKKYKLAVTKQLWDIKYSVGNIQVVNNIVVTVCGARWVLDSTGGSLRELYECLSTMLYI